MRIYFIESPGRLVASARQNALLTCLEDGRGPGRDVELGIDTSHERQHSEQCPHQEQTKFAVLTDTKGKKAEKKEASGHKTDAMLNLRSRG